VPDPVKVVDGRRSLAEASGGVVAELRDLARGARDLEARGRVAAREGARAVAVGRAREAEALVARPIKQITVKGRQQAFVVYEPLVIAGEDDAQLAPAPDDLQLQALGEQALAQRAAGDVAACIAAYRAILDLRPDDEATRRLMAELEPEG